MYVNQQSVDDPASQNQIWFNLGMAEMLSFCLSYYFCQFFKTLLALSAQDFLCGHTENLRECLTL